MKYILNTPLTVGDLDNPITIDQLEIASISINFEPHYSDQGTAILSVVLVHRDSDYKFNPVENDAAALAFWNSVDGVDGTYPYATPGTANAMTRAIFEKLAADGKLPAGTIQA